MIADLAEIRQRIKDGFFVNIFMAISQMEGVQPRNELELTKRDLERLQVLGPFIQLFETEAAGPILKRVLAIMERRGIIQPRPPSMARMPIKIDFVSILRLAQRAAETASMERTFAVAGSLSEAAKRPAWRTRSGLSIWMRPCAVTPTWFLSRATSSIRRTKFAKATKREQPRRGRRRWPRQRRRLSTRLKI